MSTWTADELDRIAAADELRIAPRRRDGSLSNPVTIWVVRRGGDLYVRSALGGDGRWYRNAQASHEGHVDAGGVGKDVTFADETDGAVNDEIDAAYRTKYRDYDAQYVDPMVTERARATTLRLTPR
ncbi:MAG TPA: DUF2255 family protein [Actinophytocola sp.]|jgi:hypothetical protein|uniref:DUF2255 family protein n=1 Tax=Actinophytocola sp. TaxID=1872138 RepID=UPI002F95D7E3